MKVTAQLLARHDRPGPRYTSYPTALDFGPAFGPAQYEAALQSCAQGDQALSLYVHVPFCPRRCAYCGCTTACAEGADLERYFAALMGELGMLERTMGRRRPLAQLHLGGGTPSSLGLQRLLRLHERLSQVFELLPNAEQALEADPRSSSPELLEALASRGFNRISLGVQDFDEQVQAAIGRDQSYEQVATLCAHARALGFASVNFDLVYGLPRQSTQSFARTLQRVVELRPDRLAVYSFAYLPKLRENQLAIAQDELPSPSEKLDLLALTHESLCAAGYQAIGIDHYALPSDELARASRDGRLSRSFMGYTVQAATQWFGVGASAIGYVGNAYAQNGHDVSSYQQAIEGGRFATARGFACSPEDLLRGELIRELLCNFRIDFEAIELRYGIDFGAHFAAELQRLEALSQEGLLQLSPRSLEATPLGRVFARNIAMVFDTYLPRHEAKGSFSRTV